MDGSRQIDGGSLHSVPLTRAVSSPPSVGPDFGAPRSDSRVSRSRRPMDQARGQGRSLRTYFPDSKSSKKYSTSGCSTSSSEESSVKLVWAA